MIFLQQMLLVTRTLEERTQSQKFDKEYFRNSPRHPERSEGSGSVQISVSAL